MPANASGRDSTLTEYVQQHHERHACRRNVPEREQPAIERCAPYDRVDAFVVLLWRLLVGPERRRCIGRECEPRAKRAEFAYRLLLVERHTDATLRSHSRRAKNAARILRLLAPPNILPRAHDLIIDGLMV